MAIRMTGLTSGLDTESIIAELMSAQNSKKTKIESKITKLEWKKDKWKELNTKIYSFYTDSLSKFRLQSTFNTKKVSSSDESKATATASTAAPQGTHTLQVKKLASSQFVTGAKLGTDINSKAITTSTKLTDLGMTAGESNIITITAGDTTKTVTVSATSTVNDVTAAFKGAGLNASYDTTQKRFFISTQESGYESAFSITTSGSVDLTKLGLSQITKTDNEDGTVSVSGEANISLVAPSDATYIYNGATLTSTTNNVTANGLTFTLQGLTEGADTETTADDKAISLTVSDDTQAVYDSIKSFVKSYNELLEEMNDSYYADTAKGYNPLTDDEKEAMSDDEVDQWETKIKASLLRRDDNLGTLINTLRTSLTGSKKVDGKDYALSSFGIKTAADYSEKGKLHIDGDSDDSTTSAQEDKLLKALTENPDAVMETFNELAGNLYKTMTKSMSSSTLRSALNVYNDKEMSKTLANYEDELDEMEDRLQEIEDRYYKQFSAMETAMSKMNSQSSSLASLLGTSG